MLAEKTVSGGYKKLIAWQKADDLAYQVYIATKSFPKEEIYGITSQLRRAVLSIPTNIAEGCARQNKKEWKHFVNIALGSLAETEYLLNFCKRLEYLGNYEHRKFQERREEIGRLLWKLFKSI